MQLGCPSCAKQLQLPDSAVGKKAKCPACGHVFDVIDPSAVAATPMSPAYQGGDGEGRSRPTTRDDDDLDDRPRRRSSREDDEDDRPRRRFERDDDDRSRKSSRLEDDDYDDRPRRRGDSAVDKASWVAMWLQIGAIGLIAHLLVFSIGSFFVADAWNRFWERGGFNVNFGGMQVNMPAPLLRQNPVGAMMISLLVGLVFYGAFVVFMFIGASNWRNTHGRGLAMTAVILATIAGGLLILQPIFDLINYITWFQIVRVMFSLGVAAVLLVCGIRGLMIAGHPDVKDAFGVREPGRRRRRSRDDDY